MAKTEYKLYTVSVTTELVVVARSLVEAEQEANHAIRFECLSNLNFSADELTTLPRDWDLHCIPFGNIVADDMTIGDWIEIGAAPKFKQL